MITDQRNPGVPPRGHQQASSHALPQLDVMGALWRYRWAVVIPTVVFGLIGFLVYHGTSETYRSSTKLMVESNRPPVLDAMTGEVLGGVPDIEVLEAQVYSDRVALMAYEHIKMKPFRVNYGSSSAVFAKAIRGQLSLEPEVTDVKSAQSLVTWMHFDSPNQDLSEAAVQAFSQALQEYFNARHQSTQTKVSNLLHDAITKLSPRLVLKEKEYSEFKTQNMGELSWDSDGHTINPYSRQRDALIGQRAALEMELRREKTILAQIERVAEDSRDPMTALNVMGQLLGVNINALNNEQRFDPLEGDSMLAEIDLEKKLLPLIITRNQLETQFGDGHPSVKAMDQELKTTREELARLVKEQADRITKLREQHYQQSGSPSQRATDTVNAVIFSNQAKVMMLQNHLKQLDDQIDLAKSKAIDLAKLERQDEEHRSELDRYRKWLTDFDDNLSRVQISEEESVTQVAELQAPTAAYVVAPNLIKLLGLGILVGLVIGSGSALLLEKNANTFRAPEDIPNVLGLHVLAHVPFFRGKRRKNNKDEVDPYSDFSIDIAVVHQPASAASEAIRSLRTSVFFETNQARRGTVIQVTSPLPGDGKSTIASNLACSMAQSGKRVLAIDADLRRPQLTDNFQLSGKPGLTSVLDGQCDPLDAAYPTALPKLSIMPCGGIPGNPAEALSLPVMNELLQYLRDHFDYILLDTPPLLVVTDPSICASMADAVILALKIRRKCKPNAREAVNILNSVGANVLGVTVNNSEESASSDGYRAYGYYRYGRYAGGYERRGGVKGPSVAVSSRSSSSLLVSRAVGDSSTIDGMTSNGDGVGESRN
ncbi:Tyrosine-protein kinase ptk [Stieleria bergensis]|uniref:non-specific protein-tyrosine kinase n=1 Tax=Stieleria bergensis TaxID=2528025 RepID=A0A517SVX2_9BACT|nr:Tyrosine-protein kinase ptk [Planctomycetes bacterium SV_7m_r]